MVMATPSIQVIWIPIRFEFGGGKVTVVNRWLGKNRCSLMAEVSPKNFVAAMGCSPHTLYG